MSKIGELINKSPLNADNYATLLEVDYTTVWRWCKGISKPRKKEARQLAELLSRQLGKTIKEEDLR